MKLLSDYVLIEQDELVQEEKRDSGIVTFKSTFDLYQFGEDHQKVEDILYKKKNNKGKIFKTGLACSFAKEGDSVIYKRQSETGDSITIDGKEYVFVCEKYVLAKNQRETLIPNPNYTLVKITRESRDAVFSKKIKRDDGTMIDLFVAVPVEMDQDASAKYFVSSGIIVSVGENVQGVKEGDIAILNYLCDNDESVIVAYDGEDKIIAVNSVTVRHKDDNIINPSRKNKTQQIVWMKGDYDITSNLIGIIRGDELISIDPYIFFTHQPNIVEKKTASGIMYAEKHNSFTREVIAASEASREAFDIASGDEVLVHDLDIFDIVIQGRKISAINDADILAKVEKV